MRKRIIAEIQRNPLQALVAIVTLLATPLGVWAWIANPFWENYVTTTFFAPPAQAVQTVDTATAKPPLNAAAAKARINALVAEANQLRAAGSYGGAEQLYTDALDLAETTFGPATLDYAQVLDPLASLKSLLFRLDEAQQDFRLVLGIFEEHYGRQSIHYANMASNYVGVLRRKNDYAAARPILDQALETFRTLGLTGTREYAIALQNYGGLQKDLGNHPAAIATFEEALPLIEELAGKHSRDYANLLGDLSGALLKTGRREEAETMARQAVSIIDGLLPESHPDRIGAQRWLDPFRSTG